MRYRLPESAGGLVGGGTLDVIEHIPTRLGDRCVSAPVDPLALEHAEESLGGSIAGTVPDGPHAAERLGRPESAASHRG